MPRKSINQQESVPQRYGSEKEVERIFGISARTLQHDRLLGRERFPSYRAGRRVLYDLTEIQQIIQQTRRGGTAEV